MRRKRISKRRRTGRGKVSMAYVRSFIGKGRGGAPRRTHHVSAYKKMAYLNSL
jgi:hypothetical protein